MKSYRIVMGEKLKEFRLSMGLSAYRVAKDGGLQINQVNAVESGETNYTIDIFLRYVRGCNLYLYFGEKDNPDGEGHDFEDLVAKGIANNPRNNR